MHVRSFLVVLFGVLSATCTAPLYAQTINPSQQSETYIKEYCNKIKWGYAEEFVTLYKQNHYPILLKQKEQESVLSVKDQAPTMHATEESLWDYRVTVIWRERFTSFEQSDGGTLLQTMYPDQEEYKKEEQRRFELLLCHWDVPITPEAW